MADRMRGMLDRVAAFPLPVIAALNGHALGGGAEVAVAADIRIAADDVRIGFNQVSLGIMPAWGGAERLAQRVGRSRAMLAVATGELYDAPAAQAHRPGRHRRTARRLRRRVAVPRAADGVDRARHHPGGQVGHRRGDADDASGTRGCRLGRVRPALDFRRALGCRRRDDAARSARRRAYQLAITHEISGIVVDLGQPPAGDPLGPVVVRQGPETPAGARPRNCRAPRGKPPLARHRSSPGSRPRARSAGRTARPPAADGAASPARSARNGGPCRGHTRVPRRPRRRRSRGRRS